MAFDVIVRFTVNAPDVAAARDAVERIIERETVPERTLDSWALLHEHPCVREGDDVDPGRVLRVVEETESPTPPPPVVLVPSCSDRPGGGCCFSDGDVDDPACVYCKESLPLPVDDACPDCEGGYIDKKQGAREWTRERCETCKGTGKAPAAREEERPSWPKPL